jgi:hypothetical protein
MRAVSAARRAGASPERAIAAPAQSHRAGARLAAGRADFRTHAMQTPTKQPIPPDDETPENPPDTGAPEKTGKPHRPEPPDESDNALELLGKAVSAPVLGAADEDPDAPETHGSPDERRP